MNKLQMQTPVTKKSLNSSLDKESSLENQHLEDTHKTLVKFKEEFDASQRKLLNKTETIISMQAEKDKQITSIDSTLKELLIKVQTGFEGVSGNKDLQTKILEVTASKEAAFEETASLKISINEKVKEIEDLNKRVKHLTEENKDNNSSQAAIKEQRKLQIQLAEITDKLTLAMKKNKELQAAISQNVEENKTLQSQIVKLTEEMKAVSRKDEQLHRILSQKVQENSSLQKQMLEFTDKVTLLKNKNAELISTHIAVTKKSTQVENLQKQLQLAEVNDKAPLAESNNEKLQKENESIQMQTAEELKHKDEQLKKLQLELDCKIKENEKLKMWLMETANEQKMIAGLQSSLGQKFTENIVEQKGIDEILAGLQATLDHKTEENNMLHKQVTTVDESLKDKNEEFLTVQESTAKDYKKLSKEIAQITDELNEKSKQLKSFQLLLAEKEQENKLLQKQFTELQANENLQEKLQQKNKRI